MIQSVQPSKGNLELNENKRLLHGVTLQASLFHSSNSTELK